MINKHSKTRTSGKRAAGLLLLFRTSQYPLAYGFQFGGAELSKVLLGVGLHFYENAVIGITGDDDGAIRTTLE